MRAVTISEISSNLPTYYTKRKLKTRQALTRPFFYQMFNPKQ